MNEATHRYTVTGMSCGHCAQSVTAQVREVAGVEGVEIDLGSGLVTVSGAGVDDSAVRAAVAEAGYEVVA